MIFRVSQSTKIKNLYIDKYDRKEKILIRCKTYWFLFVPVITVESDIT